MNIIDAMRDPHLFGSLPAFADLTTWAPWLTFLRAVYGLPMDAEDVERFRKHTGRQAPKAGGYPEAVCVVGCQSGKSQVAALVQAFEAASAETVPGRGELYALAVAQDQRSSTRTLFAYADAAFATIPMLAGSVRSRTAETVSLKNGVVLAAYPCRPAAIRGVRAVVVVLDELAFYVGSEGRPTDKEMLRAARSRVATTGGRVLILSSPYHEAGELYELHRAHYGRETSPVLVWQASAPEMNPTLTTDYLERMREVDPEAYRSEVLGEFRSGVSTLLDPEALDAIVASGVRELPPVAGITYRAFVDPSGGRADAFTLAVGHRHGDLAVQDALRVWRPPLNPTGVVMEAAPFLKSYGIRTVTGDRYAGEWPREAFRAHGIEYVTAELPKSELYLALVPRVNSGRLQLLDLPDQQRELRFLERRRGTSGRDRVDHRPGSHDDRANALAGLAELLGDAAGAPASASAAGNEGLRADYSDHESRSRRLFGGGFL